MRVREASTSASWRRTSTRSRAISIESAAAARTPSSRSRRSSSVGSWSSTAVARVVATDLATSSLVLRELDERSPVASAYASVSGSQKKSSASGSRSASARTAPISSGARTPSRTSSSNARTRRTPSYRARRNRRSTRSWIRARRGRNASATTSVARATTHGGVAADDDAEPDRDRRVDGEEQERQRHVDERAIDEALDRVQPVPHDRDPDRHDDGDLHEREGSGKTTQSMIESPSRASSRCTLRKTTGIERRRPREPHHLQPLDTRRDRRNRTIIEAPRRSGSPSMPNRNGNEMRRSPRATLRRRCRPAGSEPTRRRRRTAPGRTVRSVMKPTKLTSAAPATQRQRRDSRCPFGKTKATAIGQAVEERPRRPVDLERPALRDEQPERCLKSQRQRPEQEDPGDQVARLTIRDRAGRPPTERAAQRPRRARTKPGTNPARRSRGPRTARAATFALAAAQAAIRRLPMEDIFRLLVTNRNRCWHWDRVPR